MEKRFQQQIATGSPLAQSITLFQLFSTPIRAKRERTDKQFGTCSKLGRSVGDGTGHVEFSWLWSLRVEYRLIFEQFALDLHDKKSACLADHVQGRMGRNGDLHRVWSLSLKLGGEPHGRTDANE